MHSMLKDVQYAFRALVKRPLLTLTVATTLGLGLGANAAIFNLIDRIVLRPYAFDATDAVVLLSETGPRIHDAQESVAPANFLDWRAQATQVGFLSAYRWWDANLTERDDPERLPGFQITSGFFEALGATPALGRTFVRDDETYGRHRVVILSDALWRRRFAADPSVLGRTIIVDREPHQVVGVMPPRFSFPDGSQIWAPIAFDPRTPPRRDSRNLTAIGRLQPGATLADAQSDVSARDPPRPCLPRGESRSRRARLHAHAGDARRRPRPDALVVAGVSLHRAAHRLREHREPPAGACGRPQARDRRSPRPRRQPPANHPGVAHRKRSARVDCGAPGAGVRVDQSLRHQGQHAGQHSPLRARL